MEIIFLLKNGVERRATFNEGETVLQVAENAGISMKSFCEGQGICGACHVIVENLHDKLPQISENEQDKLDGIVGATENSRLACQIVLDKTLDGLRVRVGSI